MQHYKVHAAAGSTYTVSKSPSGDLIIEIKSNETPRVERDDAATPRLSRSLSYSRSPSRSPPLFVEAPSGRIASSSVRRSGDGSNRSSSFGGSVRSRSALDLPPSLDTDMDDGLLFGSRRSGGVARPESSRRRSGSRFVELENGEIVEESVAMRSRPTSRLVEMEDGELVEEPITPIKSNRSVARRNASSMGVPYERQSQRAIDADLASGRYEDTADYVCSPLRSRPGTRASPLVVSASTLPDEPTRFKRSSSREASIRSISPRK